MQYEIHIAVCDLHIHIFRHANSTQTEAPLTALSVAHLSEWHYSNFCFRFLYSVFFFLR